jgi:hypothetical protein
MKLVNKLTAAMLTTAFSTLLGMVTLQPSAKADTPPVVWQQLINYSDFSDWGPSQSPPGSEIADDFEVVGTITRIDVNGYGAYTGDATFNGVYVRFYGYGADNLPSTLLAEYYIPKGDPRILNQASSADFQLDLGTAFAASGKHFVSVQVSSSNGWYWRSANEGAPRNTSLYYRGTPTAAWSHRVGFLGTANCDTAFTLYGTRTLTAPSISGLSAATLAQAGRLKITGTGFGDEQGTGVVQIGGVSAPVSNWTDTSITAYVPDGAAIGADSVNVITSGGRSNALSLQVTARPGTVGHVKWRFMADDLYIQGRPAVSSDGTIYAIGVKGHLYALTPTGGVKWIFRIDNANALQPVSVGADGTIYFASIASIYAINPDGTLKWTFADPGFAIVFAGPTVGPDGNIYGATSDVLTSGGLGAFVLSPNGQLLSNLPGFSTRFGYSNIEVAFGQGEWYFTNNASGGIPNAGSIWAFSLGSTNLVWNHAAVGQPRVQPSGNVAVSDGNPVHPGVFDLTSTGSLAWHALGEGTPNDLQTAIDVGSDGSLYLGTLAYGVGRHLSALNPDGTIRWQFQDNGIASAPAVSPLNTLVLYSAYDIGTPSHVNTLSITGQLIWTENLPAENGGYIRAMSVPRFSTDGTAAYVGMDVNDYASDPYTYLYAFATDSGTAMDVVTITGAQYTTGRQLLQVKATDSNPTAALDVYVTATNTLIGTLRKNGTGYAGKFSWPTNPQNITVKSNLGGSAAAIVRVK